MPKTFSVAPARKKNFKMPTVEECMSMKRKYEPKKKPVWVYLEEEMRNNEKIKPYNHKVGIWLEFLKQLTFYNHCQEKRIRKQISKEIGPIWFIEFSSYHKDILTKLPEFINKDLIDDRPKRTRTALYDIGVTLKIPSVTMMTALKSCARDSGVFIWLLYLAIYNVPPSVPRERYDINAKLLMSSLVFIDIDECIQMFNKLTHKEPVLKPPIKKSPPKKQKLDVPFATYLEKEILPKLDFKGRKKHKQLKMDYKFRLRSQQSFEKLRMDTDFLEVRKARKSKKDFSRVCHYKFIVPPIAYKCLTAAQREMIIRLRNVNKAAVMTAKPQIPQNLISVGGVSFSGYENKYVVNGVTTIPNTYIKIEEGHALVEDPLETSYRPILGGHVNYLKKPMEKKCDCLKYEDQLMENLKNKKCKCRHTHTDDYGDKGPIKAKYMQPPNKYGPMMFDPALIYQLNPVYTLITDAIDQGVESRPPTPEPVVEELFAEDLKPKVVLALLLADLAKTSLIIPHLPDANCLKSLLAWVRMKIHGKLTPKEDKTLLFRSQRRWLQLAKMDFRERAYHIPFTEEHLKHMTWMDKEKLHTLFTRLLNDFVTRNRLKQVEQSRMWWSTMKYDLYPGKSFLDAFFTFIPANMKDTYLNPHLIQIKRPRRYRPC